MASQTKKVLLVALNSSWSQSNLALYYLRQILREYEYPYKMLEITVNEPLLQVAQEIYEQQVEILLFSAYIWNKSFLKSLLNVLKQLLPRATFVIGGPEAAAFKADAHTFIIPGAGEGAFKALAESEFETLPQESRHIPLKDVPFPYDAGDVEVLADHLVYYECYRGCPYGCVYCLSANDRRNEARFDLNIESEREKLKSELDSLVALKPRTLKFIDRSFNIAKDLAHYIWRYAAQDTSTTDFHFEIYPELLDDADFALLKEAPWGKIRFEVGVQSVNPEVMAASGRHSDWQKVKRNLLRLKEETKIRVHADLLAGLPGEDLASVLHSLDELCACEPAAVQLGMLKILPDTPMLEIAQKRGYLWMEDAPYQVLSSDALSFAELSLLDDYAHLLNLYWNKEEYPGLWHELLQKHRVTQLLIALKRLHTELGYPLHSISKLRRMQVMERLASEVEGIR